MIVLDSFREDAAFLPSFLQQRFQSIEIKSRHVHNNTRPHPLPRQNWTIIFIHLFDSNGLYSRNEFLSYHLCVEAV